MWLIMWKGVLSLSWDVLLCILLSNAAVKVHPLTWAETTTRRSHLSPVGVWLPDHDCISVTWCGVINTQVWRWNVKQLFVKEMMLVVNKWTDLLVQLQVSSLCVHLTCVSEVQASHHTRPVAVLSSLAALKLSENDGAATASWLGPTELDMQRITLKVAGLGP